MAVGTTLQLKFGTMSGVKTWNFPHAKNTIENAQVKTLAQALIDNGSIYKYPPLTPDSAKIVITTEQEFDISDVTPAKV